MLAALDIAMWLYAIILTIEVRYPVVQHYIGLAYIVALPIIDW